MVMRRKLRKYCAHALLTILFITPAHAAPEVTLFERIWGNSETANAIEKESIYMRRAAIATGGVLTVAGIAYLLWKIPTINRWIRNLMKPNEAAYREIPAAHQPAAKARAAARPPVAKARVPRYPVTQISSVRQSGAECGVYALCNAYALEHCLQNGTAITNNAVQNLCRQADGQYCNANLPRQNIWSNDITNARSQLFNNVLTCNNSALLGVINTNIVSCSAETPQVIRSLANGNCNRAHFITNLNSNPKQSGHWVLISVVRNGNQFTFYYMDSAGNSAPNEKTYRAIGFLRQQLGLN